MGCKPILEYHRRVVAMLTVTFGVNGPLAGSYLLPRRKILQRNSIYLSFESNCAVIILSKYDNKSLKNYRRLSLEQ